MMLDSELQLERALARISEPNVTVISTDPVGAPRLPERWRIQRCARPVAMGEANRSDLIVIDGSFVDRYSPIEECRELTGAPLVVVVEDDDEAARYLELGADACVSRAAAPQEWQARFQAIIRPIARPSVANRSDDFQVDDLSVSIERQEIVRGGTSIDLTPREFGVLRALLTASPAAVRGERIADALWGSSTPAAMTRVRVYIARLRRKLELDPSRPRVIVTDGGSYRTTLHRTQTERTGTHVLLIGHDEVTAERLRREFAHGEINVATPTRDLTARRCEDFDAILTPADPVQITRLRLALGDAGTPLIAVGTDVDAAQAVAALEAGARDIASYPGRPGDLPARVAAVVRRARTPGAVAAATLRTGALEIDLCQQRVESHGSEVPVSPTEYRLLATLARRVDHVMSHQELLTEVWGPEYREETHYIRVYVRSLRAKLEDDPANPQYVISEWGRGYRLAALPVAVEQEAAARDALEPVLTA